MMIGVTISTGPLTGMEAGESPQPALAGAVVRFDGVVRGDEAGRPIVALEYESYEPMAQNQLRALAEELVTRHGLLGMNIHHSRGVVPVGAASFRLVVYGRHRKESLAAADEFIDRMKRDVPIWKKPVWA